MLPIRTTLCSKAPLLPLRPDVARLSAQLKCKKRLKPCNIRTKAVADTAAQVPEVSKLDPDATFSQPTTSGRDRSHETDFVIIGSGIGGATVA
jgi:hypothetical protein